MKEGGAHARATHRERFLADEGGRGAAFTWHFQTLEYLRLPGGRKSKRGKGKFYASCRGEAWSGEYSRIATHRSQVPESRAK